MIIETPAKSIFKEKIHSAYYLDPAIEEKISMLQAGYMRKGDGKVRRSDIVSRGVNMLYASEFELERLDE